MRIVSSSSSQQHPRQQQPQICNTSSSHEQHQRSITFNTGTSHGGGGSSSSSEQQLAAFNWYAGMGWVWAGYGLHRPGFRALTSPQQQTQAHQAAPMIDSPTHRLMPSADQK